MSNDTPLSPEAEKLSAARKRNLDLALTQIQKDFGENAIMRLGDNAKMEVDVIPTGNWYRLMKTVFFNILVKSKVLKKRLKCFKPTHGLCQIPLLGE